MPDRSSSRITILGLGTLSLGCYIFLLYFLERPDSTSLLVTYASVFLLFLLMVFKVNDLPTGGSVTFYDWLAIVLRVSLLLAIPNLSDDFYRFIWDGRLINAGINPFAELPSHYMTPGNGVPGLNDELYLNLNSPDYFTIYPPINQLIFWIATWFKTDGLLLPVVIMRVFLMAAEIGNIIILPRVLEAFGVDKQRRLLYTLNPLVITEGVGNLHFEVMMLFFILIALWGLKKSRLMASAGGIALAVGTKLIPLIFLPFLPQPRSVRRIAIYYGLTGLVVVLLFVPLISPELIEGLQSSLTLYYQKFEFNASIYYILREQGFQEFGYNRIAYIGKDLVKWTFWLILILAWWPFGNRPALPVQLLFALGIYFLMSTTVHPWYIITLVGLSTLTQYHSPILWSFTIFLTYAGYTADGYSLPTWVLFLEYGTLFLFFVYELVMLNHWNFKKPTMPWMN